MNKQPFDVEAMDVIFCEIASYLQCEPAAVQRFMTENMPASYAEAIQRATAFVAWAMDERLNRM